LNLGSRDTLVSVGAQTYSRVVDIAVSSASEEIDVELRDTVKIGRV
jgi:hypothetical protein